MGSIVCFLIYVYVYVGGGGWGGELGAWASNQSERIANRQALDDQYEVTSQHLLTLKDANRWEHLPKPPQWGGYRLVPNRIEFWMVREGGEGGVLLFALVMLLSTL